MSVQWVKGELVEWNARTYANTVRIGDQLYRDAVVAFPVTTIVPGEVDVWLWSDRSGGVAIKQPTAG